MYTLHKSIQIVLIKASVVLNNR